MPRRAAKIDSNQRDIVSDLRDIPGVTVVPNMHDILVGYKGSTYWFEIKSKRALSRKSGMVLESQVKESQKRLRSDFTGHYKIVSSIQEILAEIGL